MTRCRPSGAGIGGLTERYVMQTERLKESMRANAEELRRLHARILEADAQAGGQGGQQFEKPVACHRFSPGRLGC